MGLYIPQSIAITVRITFLDLDILLTGIMLFSNDPTILTDIYRLSYFAIWLNYNDFEGSG